MSQVFLYQALDRKVLYEIHIHCLMEIFEVVFFFQTISSWIVIYNHHCKVLFSQWFHLNVWISRKSKGLRALGLGPCSGLLWYWRNNDFVIGIESWESFQFVFKNLEQVVSKHMLSFVSEARHRGVVFRIDLLLLPPTPFFKGFKIIYLSRVPDFTLPQTLTVWQEFLNFKL